MSSRSTLRRSFGMEALESREVLSAGGPSAEAQYMLELINMARTNPGTAAQWVKSHLDSDIIATLNYYNVDVNSVANDIAASQSRPAIGWSDTLSGTASKQSQDQVALGQQTHSGADGSSLSQRLDNAGYNDRAIAGENAYAYSRSVDHAMEAFLIDWNVSSLGHRKNILQPDATPNQFYREVGIGIVSSSRADLGPKVITQDFGRQASSKAELVGVAYNDQNGNGAYDMGEGQGNVQINATNVANGKVAATQTWDSGGGYQLNLDPGTYQVVAKVGDRVVRTDQININDQNVKVDYNLSLPWQAPRNSVGVSNSSALASLSSAPVSVPQLITPPPAPAPAAPTPVAVASVATIAAPKGWLNSWYSWTASKR